MSSISHEFLEKIYTVQCKTSVDFVPPIQAIICYELETVNVILRDRNISNVNTG